MQFKAVGGVRINVAVLAYDDKVLWDCRNFLYDFIDKTNYNLGITLTKDSSVIFHGMKFVPGGLDLILVSDHYGKEKYEEFVKTVTKTLNHTKVFFLGEEQKNEKIGESIIIVSSKEQLEKQLSEEIIRLLIEERL